MTTAPLQITTDLSTILERIERKIDDLQKDVTDLKIGQARLEERFNALEKDVDEMKGTQKNQIWDLITVLSTALLGILVYGGKILFFSGTI